jgi:hypothetical protein
MWAQDQISVLTIFFSTFEIEELDQDAMRRFVENERLVSFAPKRPAYCSSGKIKDDAENTLWSVNIVVGDDEQTYLSGSIPIFRYSRTGEPNTMLNPVPIRTAHQTPADGGA